MRAAIDFVTQRGNLPQRRWPPAPTGEQLEDLPGWITQRLAEDQVEQEAAERRKRWQKRLARELRKDAGELQDSNLSRTGPVYLQKSKHDFTELARRLESTIAKHQAARGTFERTWLDCHSRHYIRDRDGGISVKGIIFMANAIVGRQEHREYDENWSIVMNWLTELHASRSKPVPEQS